MPKSIQPTGEVLWTDPAPQQRVESSVKEKHRQDARPNKQFSEEAKTSMRFALDVLMQHPTYQSADGAPGVLTSKVEGMIFESHKPGTVNTYAPPFAKWRTYCGSRGWSPLPARPVQWMQYLAEAAEGDKSASPNDTRLASLAFFSKIAEVLCPNSDTLVHSVSGGIQKKLGYRNKQASPMPQEVLEKILGYLRSQCYDSNGQKVDVPIQRRARAFQYAMLSGGSLRWDDLASVKMATLVSVEARMILPFLVGTKTNAFAAGQWGTIVEGQALSSVAKLLEEFLEALGVAWARLPTTTQVELAGNGVGELSLDKVLVMTKFKDFIGADGELVAFPDLLSTSPLGPLKSYDTFRLDFKSDLEKADCDPSFTPQSFRVGST